MIPIIAELGINHNGDTLTLKKMVREARDAGATIVKIQKRTIGLCYTEEELQQPCESPWGDTVRHKVMGRELSWQQIAEFAKFCRVADVRWSMSCFDMVSFNYFADAYADEVPWFKVPSGLAIMERAAYLHEVARRRKRTIISTGLCANLAEIIAVAGIFREHDCDFGINHCQAIYPCPQDRLNLKIIRTLRDVFWMGSEWPGCFGVGYSGHEVGLLPSVIAAHLGAHWVERHFTLDRTRYGADQAASVEPQGLRRLVRDIRALDMILGSPHKLLLGDEKQPIKRFVDHIPKGYYDE